MAGPRPPRIVALLGSIPRGGAAELLGINPTTLASRLPALTIKTIKTR